MVFTFTMASIQSRVLSYRRSVDNDGNGKPIAESSGMPNTFASEPQGKMFAKILRFHILVMACKR
jgi:hypothetical protein